MIVEQFIFTVISLAIFVYMFFKMFKENDTNYIGILIIEAIGISLNFVEVLKKIEFGPFWTIIKYILAILMPISIIILDKKQIPLIQILNVLKAKIYLKLGNNKKAKEQLINLVSKYPENYVGHKMLAEIYELEGGMRKAIDEYVQAIDANKQDYDSYYKIAELLNNLEKPDEAAEMLFNLLNKKPDYYRATELLGDILISKEMYKEAVNVYQNALKYNPLNFDINYNLGIAYTMLNDFQNAKICYEKAAELNSLVYNTKYSLAEIAMMYKELDEAEKYFLQATEDEELCADAYLELSKICIIRNEKDQAIRYANVAIQENPKRIVEKIQNDVTFAIIIARLSIPFNLEIEGEEERPHKLTAKEIKAKEHLEEMVEITKKIGYNDIQIKKIPRTSYETRQEDRNQKEREE